MRKKKKGKKMLFEISWKFFVFVLLITFTSAVETETQEHLEIKLFTIATDPTDGYNRFMKSAKHYGYDVEVCGMNQKWLGGDLSKGPGGGFKIKLLIRCLKQYKEEKDMLAMFTDSYDVVLNQPPSYVLKQYKEMNASVIFSAEDLIWPDRSLAKHYPDSDGYRYLCSGGYIGPVSTIWKLLLLKDIENRADDQLYFTNIFLESRHIYDIVLDTKAVIFQNLNGNKDDVDIDFSGNSSSPDTKVDNNKIYNKRFNTYPAVIHGNGPSKLELDRLSNYFPREWHPSQGCLTCDDGKFSLAEKERKQWPVVVIGLFVYQPTPFVAGFLEFVSKLDYPKDRIFIFLYNNEEYHDNDIEPWVAEYQEQYMSLTYKGPKSFITPDDARTLGMQQCKTIYCDYYFSLDSEVTLSNPKTLQLLIEQNRTFITPILSQRGKLFSNFWGAIENNGYYARAPDYLSIVRGERVGVWNSPYVTSCYLIRREKLSDMVHDPFYAPGEDFDMIFAANNRKKGIFMYATNIHEFGHLKKTDTYSTTKKNGDLYQLFDNQWDWERNYLHKDYHRYLKPNIKKIEPCPDVYTFPFVNERWTKQIIQECEAFGKWSDGKKKDKRVAGGYENVPTVDIHMNQIGYEKHWLQMLKLYIKRIVENFYTGYRPKCVANMNFVVKYITEGQNSLPAHHDTSTFTINLALNNQKTDYEGGGVRFTRYNCSVKGAKVGWALIHPGRLTHQHEGLPTTKGVRYVMISFVDP
ncbi:procollagen-lysine,2-oxoglutarate 5-dioxygenase 1-like [Clytia hemisphaerica]